MVIGMAWRGGAWPGEAWRGEARTLKAELGGQGEGFGYRQGRARQGKDAKGGTRGRGGRFWLSARQGMAGQGAAGQGTAWQGEARTLKADMGARGKVLVIGKAWRGAARRRLVMVVAALFVETNGVYFGVDGVDPWDVTRDATAYPGPWPVVAHPPCARWCRLAGFVEARWGYKRGDDGGLFGKGFV